MSHPYKSYSEHDHGRKVAKGRAKGYDSGGVVKFPTSLLQNDRNRLAGSQGVSSGRIENTGNNVVYGPGLNRTTGGTKRSVQERMKADDMPMKSGGRVLEEKADEAKELKSDKAQDKKMIKSAIRAHDRQLHGGKETKLSFSSGGRISKMTASAHSGVGRLEKTHIQASKRK